MSVDTRGDVRIATPGASEIVFGNHRPLSFILGPCALESSDHALMMASKIAEICATVGVSFVFKASFDKANRTSNKSYRGVGLDESLEIFAEIKKSLGIATLTDVHLPEQCDLIAPAVDVLQIPAFLCRQTDLLQAAAETGRVVNVKKGQFLAPWDMRHVVDKLRSFGAADVIVTERGTSFGYNTLISDMTALPELASYGCPVVFDATHSVQQPGGQGASSGGRREHAPVLARAAVAVGVAGVFIETHNDPDNAPSDGPNMIPLDQLESVLSTLKKFDTLRKSIEV
ncbi:MAG: 3-deoxy-8-phosphooctulonate synthase [Pseudomonadota bacterium]